MQGKASLLKQPIPRFGGINLRTRVADNLSISSTEGKRFLQVFNEFLKIGVSDKMLVGWVADCIDIWGKGFSKAKFRLYDRTQEGEPEVLDHNFVDIIKKPNDFMTFWEFMYKLAMGFSLSGDNYWLKLRQNGIVRQILPLTQERMQVKSSADKVIDHYEYMGHRLIRIEPEDIIHFRYPDYKSNVSGRAIISGIKDVARVDALQTAYQKVFFEKGGFIGLAFSSEQSFNDEEFDRALGELQKQFGGEIDDNYEVALFEKGLKPVPATHSIKDMDISALRNITRDEIIASFQVPKILLGQGEAVNRATAEAQLFQFGYWVLDPVLDYVDNVINQFWILPEYGSEYYVAHDSLTPRNRELELQTYKEGITDGWMSVNEVRSNEGLDLWEDEFDRPVAPRNNASLNINNKDKNNDSENL